jgi:hypothetical protein
MEPANNQVGTASEVENINLLRNVYDAGKMCRKGYSKIKGEIIPLAANQ